MIGLFIVAPKDVLPIPPGPYKTMIGGLSFAFCLILANDIIAPQS
jgi:hypothetical protein